MIQDKLSVSLEAKLALVRFFGELLSEVYRRFGVTPGELINLKFKKQHITPAREWVVRELRQNVWQWRHGKLTQIAITYDDHGRTVMEDDDRWQPISYPMLADLLGFHHSALIHMMQRIAKREAKEKRETDLLGTTRPSDTCAMPIRQTDVPTGRNDEQ